MEGRRVRGKELRERIARANKWYSDNAYVCSRMLVIQVPGLFHNTLTVFCSEPSLNQVKIIPVDKDDKPEAGTHIKTRLRTICNALGVQIGEVFMWKPEGFGSLMALGIFDYADAEVSILSDESVQLRLYLREKPSGKIEPGAGMSTDGRVFGDISVSDNNFMGRAQRLRVAWQKRIDEGRSSGGILFEDMRIGANIPLSFKFKAYRDSSSKRGIPVNRSASEQRTHVHPRRDNRDFDSQLFYEKDRDGIMVDIGFRPKDTFMMYNLTPKFEIIHPNLVDSLSASTTSQMVLQNSFTHATRLPVELPRHGHIFRIEHSVGNVLRSSNRPFQKALLSASQYFGMKRYASVAIAGSIGLGSENLPWHEQKSLGGHTNVRGYSYGELGRHKSYATARAELRVPLTHLEATAGPSLPADEEQKEPSEKVDGKKKSDNNEKKDDESNKLSGIDSKLPPLVGVLFGDIALENSANREILGTSYGVGLRVAGIVSIDWTRTVEEGRSSVHVGLVDRSW
ncbi:unnamed protein product [Agarophyton chilense]